MSHSRGFKLLLICIVLIIGSTGVASAKNTNSGGALYIGQTYDISAYVSAGDTVGWWESSSLKYTDSPNFLVGISDPDSFYVDPFTFSGRTGMWYKIDSSTGVASEKAFKISESKDK
jgi:hypothetical protein